MPRYEVTVEREYITREEIVLEIEAADEAAARKQAATQADEDDCDEDWYEVDGGPGGSMIVTAVTLIDEAKADEIVDE